MSEKSRAGRIAWSRRQARWNVWGLRLNRLSEWCYRRGRR